jgi:hypothetical protein
MEMKRVWQLGGRLGKRTGIINKGEEWGIQDLPAMLSKAKPFLPKKYSPSGYHVSCLYLSHLN